MLRGRRKAYSEWSAELGELFLDVSQCIGQCGAPMLAGGALGEDAFPLSTRACRFRVRSASRAWATALSCRGAAVCFCCFSTDLLSNPCDMG